MCAAHTFVECLQCLGWQPMAPQFAQMTEVDAQTVLVPEDRKNELRRECATQQIGDIPQQIEAMGRDVATHAMRQGVPAIETEMNSLRIRRKYRVYLYR